MDETTRGTDPAELYRRGCELLDAPDTYDPDESPADRLRRHAVNAAYAHACFAGAQAGAMLLMAADAIGVDDRRTEERWLAVLGLGDDEDGDGR